MKRPPHSPRLAHLLGGAFALMGLSACAVGPDFVRPTLSPLAPQHFSAPSSVSTQVSFGADRKPIPWWESLQSPAINGWVEKALANSPSAKLANATLERAAAEHQGNEANLYPQVDLTVGASRQTSLNTALTVAGDQKSAPTTALSLFNSSVNVRYLIDIFGTVRRGNEASAAQLTAAQWEWQAAMNTLAGNVVTTAISLANAREQTAITENLQNQQKIQLETVKKQRHIGAVSDVEVANAELALATTRLSLPPLRKLQKNLENQLLILMGEYPSDQTALALVLSQIPIPAEIPLLVPSQLIQSRPDIQIAQAQLETANALVGLAQAQFYPQLAITGSITSQALKAANLWDTTLWSLASSITQPLFRGGVLTSQEKIAQADHRSAKARYEQTVLHAFGEVSNALTALTQDEEAFMTQQSAFNAAEHAYRLAKERYRAGSLSQYDLLSIERVWYLHRVSLSQALATRINTMVALYLAAGAQSDFSPYTASALIQKETLPVALPLGAN